jgi:hypothetical protein
MPFMRKIRGIVYRLGFRPKQGSIFHSPSLNFIYATRTVNFGDLFEHALQKQIKENNNG